MVLRKIGSIAAIGAGVALGIHCQNAENNGGVGAGASGGGPDSGATGGQAGTGIGGMGGSPAALVSPGASFAPGSLCETDGWCWYNPLPSGAGWQGVAGAGRTEAWIGGASQTLLHLEGGHWTAVSSSLFDTESVWAASATDVWFAGISKASQGAVSHWDGSTLSPATELGASELNDVWGTGPTDVYAVGNGTVQHWDGRAWTAVPGIFGQTVSASGPNDVWIGASNGLQHFDGTSWSRVPALEATDVVGVAALAGNDVWVAAIHGGVADVEHFDGTAWTVSFHIPNGNEIIVASLAASSSRDVWVVGSQPVATVRRGYVVHFDGAAWAETPVPPSPLSRVRTMAGIGTVAVGPNGGILLLTGGSTPGFKDERSGPIQDLSGVWGSSPADVWATGGAGTVLHFDGHAVTTVPTGVSVDLSDTWGTAPDDLWAVGGSGTALRFDGTGFRAVPTGASVDLKAVFTAARNDVWAGGGSTLLHFDGQAFTPVPLPGTDAMTRIFDMGGTSASDVWLCGHTTTGGFVAHFDGVAWSPVLVINAERGSFPATRIWSLAPNDVWVLTQLGFAGRISYYHFDGATWSERFMAPSPETFMFPKPVDSLGSFAFGPHDVWLVGALGTWQHSTQ
jgi:hypothetical protein